MFPVTSPTEMAGQYDGGTDVSENDIASRAAAGDLPGIWSLLTERLQGVDEYVVLFKSVYPDEVKEASDITFVHAANALTGPWRHAGSYRRLKDVVMHHL